MKVSNMLLPTLRDVPSEAEIPSQRLMLRAGLIRKTASGIYNYLPLGIKVLRRIEQLIREEMDRQGSQEISTPGLIPAEMYQESGRWEALSSEVFKLKDRSEREFCLGAVHEEVLIDVIRNDVKSYKAFPVSIYQVQTKYRDEKRPRFGVMRARAFTVSDACSFDLNRQDLDISYDKMHEAYSRIFERCGLNCSSVEASLGEEESVEFVMKSDIGESEIAFCKKCGYKADAEKAPCTPEVSGVEAPGEIQKVSTPDIRTIEELVKFLNTDSRKLAKTLIYRIGGKVVAVMVRGDREVNDVKLSRVLNANFIEMADPETVQKVTHAEVGFAGPVGINVDMLIADSEVAGMHNFIVGANDTGYHLVNVNYGRDFKADKIADVRRIASGDGCPKCGAPVFIERGIKIGSISKIGTRYSEDMNAYYIDESGNEKPVVMGSYSLGLDRIIAAVIEQHHDDNGIKWPLQVAPYHVIIVPVVAADAGQMKAAEEIYNKLKDSGVEVLLDDRNERAGVKFKDADLIGIPIRITIGRKLVEGIVEYKLRSQAVPEDVRIENVHERVLLDMGEEPLNIG